MQTVNYWAVRIFNKNDFFGIGVHEHFGNSQNKLTFSFYWLKNYIFSDDRVYTNIVFAYASWRPKTKMNQISQTNEIDFICVIWF